MSGETPSSDAEVILASVASLRNPDRLCKYNPKDFKLIIIDETHHAPANSYMLIQKHFEAHTRSTSVAVAGFSATLSRHDGIGLGSALDYIVYHKELLEMIREGYLCDMKISVVETDADVSNVPTSRSSRDFNVQKLSPIINTDDLNKLVVNTWKYYSKGGNKYKCTLIFGVDKAHVKDMADCFNSKGIAARYVTANSNPQYRIETIEAFTKGEFPVLINCGIFTEGTDIPSIDQIIINRPTKSMSLLTQMVGRGLRKYESKTHCHVIDMVSSLRKGALATVPTLAGLDPLQVATSKKMVESVREVPAIEQKYQSPITNIEITNYENILQFTSNNKSNTNRKNIYSTMNSRYYNWLKTNKDSYILGGPQGYLRLQINIPKDGTDPSFSLKRHLHSVYNPSRYTHKTMLENEPDLYRALNTAENYAVAKFKHNWISRTASWRNQKMTPKQKEKLFSSAAKSLKLDKTQLPEWIMTASKGLASDLLTLSNATHGAIFRWMAEKHIKDASVKDTLNDLKQENHLFYV